MKARWPAIAGLVAFGLVAPVAARAQTAPAVPAAADSSGQSRAWVVVGGASTTVRGDCQEDCPAHGTGDYLHSGSLRAIIGARLNRHMDTGVEVMWVPSTSRVGDEIRSTFLLAAIEFKPWPAHGFFLSGSMGMAFVRNFIYDGTGTLPPVTSKGLGLSYGTGWTFRQRQRVGLQLYGTQHMAAIGDFQPGGVPIQDVIGNYWSAGAALVIR